MKMIFKSSIDLYINGEGAFDDIQLHAGIDNQESDKLKLSLQINAMVSEENWKNLFEKNLELLTAKNSLLTN